MKKWIPILVLYLLIPLSAWALRGGGGTAPFSGDFTCTGAGVCTVTKTSGTAFATIATSGSASDLSAGTVPAARLPVARCGGPVAITSLPTCNAGNEGLCYNVTDALLPALGSVIANGGAVKVTVSCVNGTGWIP